MTFAGLAASVSSAAGSPVAFALAVGVVLAWAATGPVFQYSEGWQLVVNTGTTIATFWLGFLILNTQNRDMAAIQLKLDELVRVTDRARNELVGIERREDGP